MPEVPEYYLPLLYAGAGLLGLVSWFMGFRLFRLVIIALLSVAGAALLAWAGFHYGEEPVIWSIGGLVLGAVLGGVLALFFYSLAVATLGALFVATSLLPWVQPYEVWVQWTVLGVACGIAALVAVSITNLMIQLGSAMVGAFLIVHSVLYFTTGETVHQITEGESDWTLYLDLDPYVAGIVLGLGLLGFLIQRRAAK